jgi:hypothetical protein
VIVASFKSEWSNIAVADGEKRESRKGKPWEERIIEIDLMERSWTQFIGRGGAEGLSREREREEIERS